MGGLFSVLWTSFAMAALSRAGPGGFSTQKAGFFADPSIDGQMYP
jgi:hypothetical protein